MNSASPIQTIRLGLLDYLECFQQQLLYCDRARRESSAFLLVAEHPPVITLGKHGNAKFILKNPKIYGAEVVRTDRGGEATAHMPGQLVVYPIVPLSVFRLMPKQFIGILEQVVVGYLESLGIPAGVKVEYPGIWSGDKKLCAVGVRIENRVTRHGLALNIANDLSLFSAIVPCGITHMGVGRVRDFFEGENCPSVEKAGEMIALSLTRALLASHATGRP